MSATELQFRTATFGGFQKQDVLSYIESSNQAHVEKLEQLQRERDELAREKEELAAQAKEAREQVQALTREKEELTARLDQARKEAESLRSGADNQKAQLEQAAAREDYVDSGYVLTDDKGEPRHPNMVTWAFRTFVERHGLPPITVHGLRHTFATRALERGMDYKTLSAILGHYSVAFTMDTYVHSMDEHKRREMDKMNGMFGMQYRISVENQPYPVLCTLSADGCIAHAPDFPKIVVHAPTLDAALLEVKQQIQKALHQYKYPPIPTRQEQIVVPDNSVLVLVKAG